jgi:hypothetical protein
MPSLVYTLRGWYWTVRALMNMRAHGPRLADLQVAVPAPTGRQEFSMLPTPMLHGVDRLTEESDPGFDRHRAPGLRCRACQTSLSERNPRRLRGGESESDLLSSGRLMTATECPTPLTSRLRHDSSTTTARLLPRHAATVSPWKVSQTNCASFPAAASAVGPNCGGVERPSSPTEDDDARLGFAGPVAWPRLGPIFRRCKVRRWRNMTLRWRKQSTSAAMNWRFCLLAISRHWSSSTLTFGGRRRGSRAR